VAGGTLLRRVHAGQREPRAGVIERGALPSGGGVAYRTVLREAGRDVIGILRAVEIRQMARNACRAQSGELPGSVAGGALLRGVHACQRELRAGVIERGALPSGSGVAYRTVLREAGGDVVRILRAGEVLHVAGRAGRVEGRELAGSMARGALLRGVHACQRELRAGVVELCGGPSTRVMTQCAVLGEARGHMVRVLGAVEVGEVASGALRRSPGEFVVQVALCAVEGGVSARQSERRLAVIELRSLPLDSVVAQRAIRRQAGRGVAWLGRLVVVREVAPLALRRSARELVPYVALCAFDAEVRPGQLESGQCVIELRSLPLGGGVARRAVGGQLRGAVVGVLRSLVVRCVAAVAISRRPGEPAADVTGRAIHLRVSAGKGELRHGRVVETRSAPVDDGVASRAVLGKARFDVVGIAGGRELGNVATETVGRRTLKSAPDVAGCAVHRRMCAVQWEFGETSVVEAECSPVVHAMAAVACDRQARRPMVQGPGSLVILQVA